ncbi:MAG: glutamine synthetase family protein [Pseudomonadota bacterium]
MPSSPDPTQRLAAAADQLRQAHPDIVDVEVVVTDFNGVSRGKLLPIDALDKLATGGAKMPVSTLALDIFGLDLEGAGIAIEIGDPDGALVPAAETLSPMAWTFGDVRPSAQVLASLTEIDGQTPAAIAPRAVLQQIEARAVRNGLTPVAAVEIEFYLIDAERDARGRPQPPCPPGGGDRLHNNQIYDMTVLRAFQPIMAEITDAARLAGAPADALICEFGPGQFEMNLHHTQGVVAAADHAVLLRRAIRGVARKHGYDVTFMAKPYGDQSGSGMHIHLSLLDSSGANIFSGPDDQPNQPMRHALGGLKDSMDDTTLAYAPHANSYRRFMPGSYAPLCAAWGIDNRGTALRCPGTQGAGARIEHRVSGADANPYLVLAAVLGGALEGIENETPCGDPIVGEAVADAGALNAPPLPNTWAAAVDAWAGSEFVGRIFGSEFQRLFAAQKRQEQQTLLARVSDAEYDAYLRSV